MGADLLTQWLQLIYIVPVSSMVATCVSQDIFTSTFPRVTGHTRCEWHTYNYREREREREKEENSEKESLRMMH